MHELPYSHKVRLADVPDGGLTLHLSPSPDARAALARHVGVPDILDMSIDAQIIPRGEGARVIGRLKARVRVTSVVSLESFEDHVDEEFCVEFDPQDVIEASSEALEEGAEPLHDPADALIDGVLDLGALASEFLSLGLDPYPRRPGEVFETYQEGADELSAFAALAQLKKKT